MKNLRIGTRLGAGFGLMLLILVIVGLTGYWGVITNTSATMTMLRGDAVISENASRIQTHINAMRRYEKDVFLNISDNSTTDEYYRKWQEQNEQTKKRLEELVKVVVIEKEKVHIASMKRELASYEKGFVTIFDLISSGKLKSAGGANSAIGEYKKYIHQLENDSRELAKESNARLVGQVKQMAELENKITGTLIVCIVIGIIFCIGISFVISRSITSPINLALASARRLADGDLTARVEVTAADETGKLLQTMNGMAESLHSMIEKIRDNSGQLASASAEISNNTDQLAKAAHNQASAAEQTSATMVQMAASIQIVANNSVSLASNADEVAASIQELGASSEQMAKSAEVMASSVTETSATIEQMSASIEKVAQNADDLNSSVTETSATIEQMTVSIDQVAGNSQELQKVVSDSAAIIEQMAASIKRVAENVEKADLVAKDAVREGSEGSHAGQQAVIAMKLVAEVIGKTTDSIFTLGKRSEEIGNIVKAISAIADQTNLLALNAAIEAARAGDAGRGFAVVAEEVRKLAERSMAATQEIAQVIRQVQVDTGESVKYGEEASREAKNSMELTTMAGNALENIVRSIGQTSALMSDISRMTAEQASASTQVIQAVEKMNESSSVVANASREQANGGRQIRNAVERMIRLTQEVTGASREQALGSRQIRSAVENMNLVTGQVTIATKEQALSARQIIMAVNSMNAMTLSVANATAEQKKGGELVVTAMDNISDIARENLISVEQLSGSAQTLSRQAADLAVLVGTFKLQ